MSRSEEVITRAMAFVAASRALRERELERRAARREPAAVLAAPSLRKYGGLKPPSVASNAGRG